MKYSLFGNELQYFMATLLASHFSRFCFLFNFACKYLQTNLSFEIMYSDNFLNNKLAERKEQQAFRSLKLPTIGAVDFCSNDYLGIVYHKKLQLSTTEVTAPYGSTGSRLLAGNYSLIEEVEQELASFHQSAAAIIYNSGYDANVGLLSCVPQKGDTILYDYLCHASIRDGIRLSFANAFSFAHNNISDLQKKNHQCYGQYFYCYRICV